MKTALLLVTITGRDRPGVTAALFGALAGHDVGVRDIEQVVIRRRLVLAVQLEVRGDSAAIRRSVLQTATELGMDCEVTGVDPVTEAARASQGERSHVIVIGRALRPRIVSRIARRIADLGANIESIVQLAIEPAASIELTVHAPSSALLRGALVQAADELGVDIAVEPVGLLRRATRLVVMDMDSTLIREEGIDVLGERMGIGDKIAEVTARAMAGEIDFAESLRSRVQLLAGMPAADVAAVRDGLTLTPGARTFVRTLRRLGYRVGVVSGGFTVFTDRFVAELGLDFAAANELEIVDGRVTGRVLGQIVDRAGKAAALARFAERFSIPRSQTVAVGDGANDIDMIEAAGLGIAFNGKAALRAAADTAVNLPYLDTVLFMLGISGDDIAEATAGR